MVRCSTVPSQTCSALTWRFRKPVRKVRYCKSRFSPGKVRRLLLGGWEVSGGPDHVDHFEAASDIHLFHDAIHMILHRKL